MIDIGKTQCLNVVKFTDFGVYLGTQDDKVLLPGKQVPPDVEVGDAVTVFVYRDSNDRLIATTARPAILLGEMSRLKVRQVTKIGAFLDWGLEKDLFLPYKEQTAQVREGGEYLVALYVDKSGRLAASMKVNKYLERANETFDMQMPVTGTVIGVVPDYRVYVAVEDRYDGYIPAEEIYEQIHVGDVVHGRISKVRDDGKLVMSLRKKAYMQMDDDAELIYETLMREGGRLGFTDKAAPEVISAKFHMSKNAFKRAVGRLLKENRIVIEEDSIVVTSDVRN